MTYMYLTYASSLPVEHRQQTTRLQTALSCTADSIFLQLNLKSAIHIFLSRSLFQVFIGRPLSLWPCSIHCSTCLAMLSSLRFSVCPIQFHFLLQSCSKTGCLFVFCHSFLLLILSGQCIFRILLMYLLMNTWILSTVLCVTVQDSDA